MQASVRLSSTARRTRLPVAVETSCQKQAAKSGNIGALIIRIGLRGGVYYTTIMGGGGGYIILQLWYILFPPVVTVATRVWQELATATGFIKVRLDFTTNNGP